MRKLIILVLSIVCALEGMSQSMPYQKIKTPYEYEYIKGSKKVFVPDTSEPLSCIDTNRISILNGQIITSYRDPISGCAVWSQPVSSLRKVGVIYNKLINSSSGAEYSTAASGTSTVSFGAVGLNLSGTVGSPGYVTHNKTSSQNFTLTAKIVINTKGGNADGIGIGIRGTALFGKDLYLKLLLDTSVRTGRIQLVSNISGIIATSTTALSVSNGDSVQLTLTRDFVNVFATAEKIGTDQKIVTSYSVSAVSPFGYINGGGLISFAHYGGSYTIRNWSWTINARSGADYFILGDSNTEFAQEEDPKASWPELLFGNRGKTYVNYAQGGNSTVSYVNNGVAAEMRAHKTKNAIVMIGTNDAGLGTMVDYKAFLNRTIDSLTDWAETVYVLSPPPRNSVDITPFADTAKVLASLYPNAVFVDIFRALKDSSTTKLPSLYDVGDGLHLNYSGHQAIAAVLANYIQANDDDFYNSIAPSRPIGLFNSQKNYFPYIKSQTSLVKSTLWQDGTTVRADNDMSVTGILSAGSASLAAASITGSMRLTGNVNHYIRSGTGWVWTIDGTSTGTTYGGTYTQSSGTTWFVGSNPATVAMFLSTSHWLGIGTNAPKAKLDANGSFAAKMDTTAKTVNYTIAATDYAVQFDASSGNLVASLPNSVGIAGRIYVIIKVDSTANTVTLSPNAGQTINGQINYVLDAQWDVVTLMSSSQGGWIIISKIVN